MDRLRSPGPVAACATVLTILLALGPVVQSVLADVRPCGANTPGERAPATSVEGAHPDGGVAPQWDCLRDSNDRRVRGTRAEGPRFLASFDAGSVTRTDDRAPSFSFEDLQSERASSRMSVGVDPLRGIVLQI